MASNPIERTNRRGTYYQVKWVNPVTGTSEQLTEVEYDDALAGTRFVTALGNKISDTDEGIVDKHYLYGVVAGRELASERRVFAFVVESWLNSKIGFAEEDMIKGLRGLVSNHGSDWMKVPVAAIGADMLNAKYLALTTKPSPVTGEPLAYSTVAQIIFRLVEVLAFATAKGWSTFHYRDAKRTGAIRFDVSSKRTEHARGALTWPQVVALVDAMPTERDKLITRLFVDTAARPGELFGLRCGDVDLANGTVTFRGRMKGSVRHKGTKGKRADRGRSDSRHTVVVGSEVLTDLATWIEGRPRDEALFRPHNTGRGRQAVGAHIVPGTWRDSVFNPVADRLADAGVLPDNVTPYWLRHTTATLLRDATGSREVVGTHLRHADPRTTAIYFDPTAEQRRILRAALDGRRVA